MSITENIRKIKESLGPGIRLVAVSKTKTNQDIMEAYHTGHRMFGENKVQELVQKYEYLPKDIEWHMIGHLQTNKVKYVVPFVECIHSVDSLKLLQHINNEAIKRNKVVNFLFQVYIASEQEKFGLEPDEVENIIQSGQLSVLSNVTLRGLMGMATFTDDERIISSEFSVIKKLFDELKWKYFANSSNFCELSIGMSSYYHIALKYGTTMVRIGSHIFGNR